jgi:transposase
MSKVRVVVLEVVSGHLTVTQASRVYGLSRQHLYRLLNRYRHGGLDAVDPRSRRPASNPRAVSDEVIIAVVMLRRQLVADGLDAGPVTLQWHLAQHGLHVPSTSTIRRILSHHGLITPQPRKRPKSSLHRFAAEQPNECWQSDFTHWTLADGSDVEILNWLDDHSQSGRVAV